MHSDQMRKDGISVPMIQGLYYDFVTNDVKTRMYSTCYDAPGALIRVKTTISKSIMLVVQ